MKKIAKKKGVTTPNPIIFLIVGIILLISAVLAVVYFAKYHNRTYFTYSSPVFTDVPDYPLGKYYYTSRIGNFVVFNEKTRSASPLTPIQYRKDIHFDGLTMSNDGKFFFIIHKSDIWKMDLNGKMIKNITKSNDVYSFSLSPNGKMIVYLAKNQNDDVKSFLVDLQSGKIIQIYVKELGDHPSIVWFNDKSDTVYLSNQGYYLYLWNIKTRSYTSIPYLQSSIALQEKKWGGSFSPSPNGKYKALISTVWNNVYEHGQNNLTILDEQNAIYFDKYHRSEHLMFFQEIGWTPDSRFYVFLIDRDTTTFDSIGVIDVVNKKTATFSIEIPSSPIKNARLSVPQYNLLNSGRVYFTIKNAQKTGKSNTQLWTFDLKDQSFEKIRDVKDDSDWDIYGGYNVFWGK